LRGDEGGDARLRPPATQFGQNVGAQQPSGHKEIPRTGAGARCGSRSTSRHGDA
jgi:hypothetical protein